MINVQALSDIQYDINQVPTSLQYLDLICDCGHRERNVGTCAHRGDVLRGMRNVFIIYPDHRDYARHVASLPSILVVTQK